MANYSEFLKAKKAQDEQWFFGETNHTSNQYFTFKHYQSEDTVVILTNNIKHIKGSPVLVVGSNKAVYLKDWQVREVHNFFEGIDTYAVKLNRAYFKPYTFRFTFDDMAIEGEYCFDDMVRIAKEQDAENMKVAQG